MRHSERARRARPRRDLSGLDDVTVVAGPGYDEEIASLRDGAAQIASLRDGAAAVAPEAPTLVPPGSPARIAWPDRTALGIGAAALLTFLTSALVTHLASAAPGIPALPAPAHLDAPVVTLVPPGSARASTEVAASLLLTGNRAEAGAAYLALSAEHPEQAVYAVLARAIAAGHAVQPGAAGER